MLILLLVEHVHTQLSQTLKLFKEFEESMLNCFGIIHYSPFPETNFAILNKEIDKEKFDCIKNCILIAE